MIITNQAFFIASNILSGMSHPAFLHFEVAKKAVAN
jgi:hypothetical protein